MPNSEEETYSIMFASMKHPARRKILRLLAEKPKNFSRILEELGISSSHLTYHLENLGELIIKLDDGRYKLSSFGKAAVLTMKGVEEVPDITSSNPLSLPVRWKTIFAVLMVAVVVLAGLSYVEYNSFSQLSATQAGLQADLAQLSSENEMLLSWNMDTDKARSFLTDVIQLDITKYYAQLESNTMEFRPDLGRRTEEVLKYSLISNYSRLDVFLRFRNKTLSRYYIQVLEGVPLYSKPQPDNLLDITSELLKRYKTYAGDSYLSQMENMLNGVDEIVGLEKTVGNIKLETSIEGPNREVRWICTSNGIDFPTKGLVFKFRGNFLEEITDDWPLYEVGSTELNVSEEEAKAIAKEYVKTISWTAGSDVVENLAIQEEPVDVVFYPHSREPLKLVPYWYVVVYLDRVYPGNINRIGIGIWGDTAEVASFQTISVG